MRTRLHLATAFFTRTLFGVFAAFSLLSAGAHAATVDTTITVNGTGTLSGSSVSATGTLAFSGGLTATGTFASNFALTDALSGSVPITLTVTTGSTTGTLTGKFTASLTLLAQVFVGTPSASGPGTIAITSGTGGFAGTTGSFTVTASGTGSGTSSSGAGTFTLTGHGTLNIAGGSTGPAAPTVTDVLNNYSFTPAGFPNSGIAPGTIFVIKGTGMADPTAQAVLQSSAAPGIPLTLNGASISVTVGGTTVHPAMYYAIATQIAAVLPAATPTGTATITVSYKGTPSAPFTFKVVPAALGIGTYNGLAIATNATDYSLYSYTKSARPGDYLVLWGSGLGAITADSDTVYTTAPHALAVMPQVYIGGLPATVLYAGNSGYPGLNQIVVTVPSGVLPGCNVSLVAVSGSGSSLVTSNVTAVAVDPSGASCSDSAFGTNGSTYSTLNGQSTVRSGFVGLLHEASAGETTDVADATFQKVTGVSFGGGAPASVGSCSLLQQVSASTSTSVGLDAGTISVTGPTGSVTLQSFPSLPGSSFAQLTAGFIPSSGGSFTFSGTGGADVGKFSTTVTFPNPLLIWTNETADATVSRASGVDVNWTGGSPGSYVMINGSSTDKTTGVTASFICYAPVAAGTFHVPNSITLSMPAGTGSLAVENSTPFQTFTASGLDIGYAFGATFGSIDATYQ